MKKILFIGIVLGAGWMGYRQLRSPFGNSHEKNVAILRSVAAELNRGLPKRLDAETTLLRVDVTNSGVVNQYQTTSLTDFRMLPPNLLNELTLELQRKTCSNRSYKRAMGKGFSISYAYVDRNNISIGTFTYMRAHCLGM